MVIFLDIDGVLITHQSIRRFKSSRVFDPTCVTNLNFLAKKLSPEIVVTSTWRIKRDVQQLTELFTKNGALCNIIGKTPHVWSDRGVEIGMWIEDNKYTGEFVIIDDEIFDMREFTPYVVKTSMDGGLQASHCIEVLNRCKTSA